MTSNRIPEGMSGPEASALPQTIPEWQALEVIGSSGRTTTISYGYAISQGWVPPGLTVDGYNNGGWANKVRTSYYDWSLGKALPRGGSGSGPAAPTYQAPDKALVRENMKAYVVATIGKADESLITAATNEYLKKDKARFQAASADAANDIDPMLAAQAIVRKSEQYISVQGNRPDSVDEMEWVVERQAKLRNLGLGARRAEDLGITAAKSGATDEALIGAAQVAQQADTGRLLRSHRESLKQSASAAMRLV